MPPTNCDNLAIVFSVLLALVFSVGSSAEDIGEFRPFMANQQTRNGILKRFHVDLFSKE